ITRKAVINMVKDMGYEVVERHIMPDELAQAKECFLTGTAAEITPVSQIGDHHMNPGSDCRKIVECYAELVRR
ncbi:MAG: aminotransferase class IV, partial [Pseudomonadota bacterium]|nr:aminotransferase class IV [Pseudomonadota bacterium]